MVAAASQSCPRHEQERWAWLEEWVVEPNENPEARHESDVKRSTRVRGTLEGPCDVIFEQFSEVGNDRPLSAQDARGDIFESLRQVRPSLSLAALFRSCSTGTISR